MKGITFPSPPKICAGMLVLLSVAGCGGSTGSDAPLVRVSSPSDGAVFRAGEVMMLEVETNGFTLRAPAGSAAAREAGIGMLAQGMLAQGMFAQGMFAHGGVIHEEDHHDAGEHETAAAGSESHQHEHGEQEDHSHDTPLLSPFADGGHLHIYFDGAAGSESHVTTWQQQTPLQLPADMHPGTHSLRIELRDDSHIPVGSEHDQFLFFEIR